MSRFPSQVLPVGRRNRLQDRRPEKYQRDRQDRAEPDHRHKAHISGNCRSPLNAPATAAITVTGRSGPRTLENWYGENASAK